MSTVHIDPNCCYPPKFVKEVLGLSLSATYKILANGVLPCLRIRTGAKGERDLIRVKGADILELMRKTYTG